MEFRVPDMGEGIELATVVRVLVQPGAAVREGQDLIEVETEKATMPIPASSSGTIEQVLVKAGDKVKVGTVLLTLNGKAEASAKPQAEPATRRLARDLGVDLRLVTGSAPGGRVTQDDVKLFLRNLPKGPRPGAVAAPGVVAVPALPDFSKYGEIERKPFSGLRKAIARNLTLAWAVAPQVTQHDLADITDLESSR